MKISTSRGLTMIELVVATAVISVLIILTMDFLVDKYVENAVANARSNMQLEAQLTLDLVNRDLKHSANVDLNNRWEDQYSPGSPGDNYSWTSSEGTLVLAEPAQDGSGDILYEDPEVYLSYKNNLIYFTAGGVFYRRTLAAPVTGNESSTTCPADTSGCPADSRLAENVSSVVFKYFDANDVEVPPENARSVEVTLSLDRIVYGRPLDVQQTIRAVFRNE